MKTSMSLHATKRCAQRGVRSDDLDLALRIGTATDDGIYVREVDVRTQVAELKREIVRLERLKGLYIAYPDRTVVTVYHPSHRRERRILRNQIRRDEQPKAA
jgi:hypothetical protein